MSAPPQTASPATPAATTPPRTPHHLRCDLRLTIGDRKMEFNQLDISVSGIARLPLPTNNTSALGELTVGQKGQARIVLAGPSGVASSITVPGRIVREQTTEESCSGFAFDWFEQESVRLALLKALTDWGYAPQANRREHERTKVNLTNPLIPTVAQLRLSDGSESENSDTDGSRLWTARINNLSPGGLLVTTESTEAVRVKPGDRVVIIIQPRDTQGFAIETRGDVRRVLERIERTQGGETLIRSFGLRFEWTDEDQHTIYLSLLKCVASER